MIAPSSDETMVVRDDEALEIGETTLVQMRVPPVVDDDNHEEAHEDAYGTVISMPPSRTTVPHLKRSKLTDNEAMDRLERKLDAALRHITALQQRIESMNATLAKVLSR